MFEYPYLIELLSPKKSDPDSVDDKGKVFSERYHRVLDAGCGVSVPDNPMGQPRQALLDMIHRFELPVHPEKTVMNLNTFHEKQELNERLKAASKAEIKYLLVIRGDGGPALPKLDPKSIGGNLSIATTMDLLRYINRAYPGAFVTGAAFNPYNRASFEIDRLKEKMEAGAKFVITQPVIGRDATVDRLGPFRIPVVLEAWMSKNVDLLFKSVRKQKDASADAYDPVENLKRLHEAYPKSCIYLSMLGFKQDWETMLPRI